MEEKKVLKRHCDESEGEEEEEDRTPSKVLCSNFSVKKFLKRLRASDCFEALEEFVQLCKTEDDNDPAVMFFKEGGQLMDVVNVLDCGQCDDSFQVSKVFAALHCLLVRVLSKVPEQKRNAEEMCNRLVGSYLDHVNKHLKVNSPALLKKVVLQLLTVVVSLNINLAKFVLSNISLTIEDANEIVLMGKPSDRQSVRTCFIQFLMAFLVQENTYVTNLLLQKRLILTSIVPGLQFDSSQLVVFVLTTLRTKIVECIGVPKTVKLHVFNTRVILELINLYEWKGPAGFIKRWQKISHEDKMHIDVDEDQLNIVAKATHSLLLALCTSHRNGVLFRDCHLGLGERKNNLVASVLKDMKFPWEHKLLSKLFIKIVEACSQFAQIAHFRVSNSLQPRATESWMNAITFSTRVISAVDLSDLVNLQPHLALQAVKTLVCPHILLNEVACGIENPDPAIRYKTILFLHAVLQATESAHSSLPKNEASVLEGYVRKFLPDGAALESAWHLCARDVYTILPSNTSLRLSNFDQMFVLLDLMLLYRQHYLSILDFAEKYVSLASSLVTALDFDELKHRSIQKIKIRVLQVLIHMDTSVLDPGEDGFSKSLATLFKCCYDKELAPEAQSTLSFILVKYGVFDSTSADMMDELGVWIHCCQIAERDHRKAILSFLQKVLVSVATNPSLFIEKIIDSQQETSSDTCSQKHQDLVHLAEKIFQELLGDCGNVSSRNDVTTELKQVEKLHFENTNIYEVSALLMGVLEFVESEKIEPSVQKYLSYVLVHLFHLQIDSKLFLSVTKRWDSMPEGVKKYIYSWLDEQPVPLEYPFGKYSPECSLSRFFLLPNRAVPELEDLNNPISVLLVARLVVFHIVQLAEREKLTRAIAEGSSEVIISLFEALIRMNENENAVLGQKIQHKLLSSVFKHPGLVNYFSPVLRYEDSAEDYVTNLLLTVLKKVNKYPEILKHRPLTELLRKKLHKNIVSHLPKETPFKVSLLVTAVECLHLSDDELHSLIDRLEAFVFKYPWNELFLYFLEHVVLLHRHVSNLGDNLRRLLTHKDLTDKTAGWIMCDRLSRYIEKFPSSADCLRPDLFQIAFCEEGLNLAVVLYRYHSECKEKFEKPFRKANYNFLKSPKVLFRFLNNCYHDDFLNDKAMHMVYCCFKEDILKAMQLPLSVPDYMTENSSSITFIIERGIDQKSCKILSDSLDRNYTDLGLCSPFHLSVIYGLVKKHAWVENPSSIVKLLLHQLILMVTEEASSANINQLCTILVKVLTDNENKWDCMLEPDESWAKFPVLFLKIALKEYKEGDENLSVNILSVLNNLLWKSKCLKITKRVFEMTTSHSRFLDVVLKNEVAGVKLAVLQLVLVCYQIAPKVMKSVHIPIWLGAYGASLSHCDQLILKILHCMHKNKEINLNAYRPFLWGEAAVNHYSIRAKAGMSLWRVPPATAAVELLNMEMVERTIDNFPVNRKFFIGNDISESNEMNDNWCSESLESCVPEVYDPAFILPLFNHLMAPENIVDDYKFCQLGGFGLTLSCLSSRCKFTRAAALCVMSRLHSHLNVKSSFSQIYEYFIEIIRGGLMDLKKRKFLKKFRYRSEVPAPNSIDSVNSKEVPVVWMSRVPSFTSSFLARASMIIINPLDTMYGVLHRFFAAKPIMDLYTIPELLELIRNSSLEFRSYQQWLLQTVLAGIRTEEDILIANKHYFYIMILCLFSSSISDIPTKILVLQILETTTKLQNTVHLHRRGLLSWLYASCTQVHEANNGKLTLAFIRLLVALPRKVKLPVSRMVPLLFTLPRTVNYEDLLPILQVVHISQSQVSKDHLVVVLQLCYKILDQDVIENCARELRISFSDISSNIYIKESGETEDNLQKSLNTINKDLLYKELRKIINAYATRERNKGNE